MKKISFARIISRLTARFKLLESEYQDFVLNEAIQPITNIDELLKIIKMGNSYKDISAAPGSRVTYYTVPTGKRWTILSFKKDATTANSYVIINDANGTDSHRITVVGTAEIITLSTTIPLDAGAYITMATTGNGGDNNRELSILYWEEDAF